MRYLPRRCWLQIYVLIKLIKGCKVDSSHVLFVCQVAQLESELRGRDTRGRLHDSGDTRGEQHLRGELHDLRADLRALRDKNHQLVQDNIQLTEHLKDAERAHIDTAPYTRGQHATTASTTSSTRPAQPADRQPRPHGSPSMQQSGYMSPTRTGSPDRHRRSGRHMLALYTLCTVYTYTG